MDGGVGGDDAPLLGAPGSVAIIGNTTWHTLGLNSTAEPRIGLQCTLYPWCAQRPRPASSSSS